MKEGFSSLDLNKGLLTSFNSQQLLKQLLKNLQQEQQLELPQLIELFQEIKAELTIPLFIFSTKTKLHPAEALYKYLLEEKKLSYQEITQLLHRHEKSIWATYQRVKNKKLGKNIEFKKNIKLEKYFLPISLFKNRSYSLLESVIFYLFRIYHLSNKDISKLLDKSPNSVAVLLKRAKESNTKESNTKESSNKESSTKENKL